MPATDNIKTLLFLTSLCSYSLSNLIVEGKLFIKCCSKIFSVEYRSAQSKEKELLNKNNKISGLAFLKQEMNLLNVQ